MAVALEFISLIIPIEKIDEHYPGGFEQYKKNKEEFMGKIYWHDDFITREGAMNPMGIESSIEHWEMFGLKGISEEGGRKHWKDMCVVDFLGGKTLPCDWLVMKEDCVAHINDKSDFVAGRTRFSSE